MHVLFIVAQMTKYGFLTLKSCCFCFGAHIHSKAFVEFSHLWMLHMGTPVFASAIGNCPICLQHWEEEKAF